jgi:hypothetical protein
METKTIQTAVQTAIAAVIIMATFATLTTTWAANRPHEHQWHCHTDMECELEEAAVRAAVLEAHHGR